MTPAMSVHLAAGFTFVKVASGRENGNPIAGAIPLFLARLAFILFFLNIAISNPVNADSPTNDESAALTSMPAPNDGRVASLEPANIKGFNDQPAAVCQLLTAALALTKRNLGYQYGSDDPQNGGMDCSGTIYHLLKKAGLKDVPRDSLGQYEWLSKSGRFHAVTSSDMDTPELAKLRPGDLLFWTGTYAIHRNPNVTHVMIYLGINQLTGKPVMVGASDGRTFNGKPRFGVSVFDFTLPRPDTGDGTKTSRFIGYGPVPGL
jgi:cell wall-associated NlpC family hydrolase